MQSRDNAVVDDMTLKIVTKRAPTDAELRDLKFAFRVAKHVKSNTIVYAKDLATVGIGAGQMSRVDSARIAARKAQDAADELKLAAPMTKGSVVASDAFFPFADGLLVAIEAGATAVIQPGGSIRDDEVIKAADDAGHRHGVHRRPAFQALNRSVSIVVPAKAGTHSSPASVATEGVYRSARTIGRGVWIPAFAGTTSERSRQVTSSSAPATAAPIPPRRTPPAPPCRPSGLRSRR